MKRRRFVQALAVLPTASALAQQAPPAGAPVQGGRGGGGGRFGGNIPKLEITPSNEVGQAAQRFFTPPQFSALRKLSDVLMPPMRGNPGALTAGAPEFLDFLIAVSPADRQRLYRTGLDTLNARAKKQFDKSFSDLDASQADRIIRPMLVTVPWVKDPPKDPLHHFMWSAHDDIRRATMNSKEYADAAAASGRRGGFGGGGGQYVLPIDPVYKG
jgi:hypothetical protein